MLNNRVVHVFIDQAAMLFIASGVALAQTDYPTKAVKVIVPFPPGGTSDVMARMMADALTKSMK